MARGVNTEAVQAELKRVIDGSGLSVNEIARRLGNGSPEPRRSQVQKWRRGDSGITYENAVRLEDALGIKKRTLSLTVHAEARRLAAARLEARFEKERQRLEEQGRNTPSANAGRPR